MRRGRSGRGKTPIWRRPLWVCPRCGNRFVNRNNWHSCGRWPLTWHFKGRPKARNLFGRFLSAVRALGRVRVVSQKTRICLMARIRFAGCVTRKDYLRAAVLLTRRVTSPRVVRIEFIPPRYYVHYFELREPSDLDREVKALIRESRSVGTQEHLRGAPRSLA